MSISEIMVYLKQNYMLTDMHIFVSVINAQLVSFILSYNPRCSIYCLEILYRKK